MKNNTTVREQSNDEKVILCPKCEGDGVIEEYRFPKGQRVKLHVNCHYCKGSGRIMEIIKHSVIHKPYKPKSLTKGNK